MRRLRGPLTPKRASRRAAAASAAAAAAATAAASVAAAASTPSSPPAAPQANTLPRRFYRRSLASTLTQSRSRSESDEESSSEFDTYTNTDSRSNSPLPASLSPLIPPIASAPGAPAVPPARTPQRVELIVKLGGSALTDKTQRHTVHRARFEAAMDTVGRLHAGSMGLVVVHGAGSFGHFEARHHEVSGGAASPLGMAETHAVVSQLNARVVGALLARGVPAVGVSPLLVPGRVRVDFVAALLDRGHLPVLHGDACYAADGRTAVLSGDALVAGLAAAFGHVQRVVFLADVPGVLRSPPALDSSDAKNEEVEVEVGAEGGKLTDRGLVRRVTVNARGEVALHAEVRTSVGGVDVTGGIAAKVAAAARCVADSRGRVVAFIAGVGTDAAERALLGRMPEPWCSLQCTRITFEVDAADAGSEVVRAADGGAAEGGAVVSPRRRNWLAS